MAEANIKTTWWFCIHCYRCFSQNVDNAFNAGIIDGTPTWLDSSKDLVYRKCPYADCDGSPIDFWKWNEFLSQDDQYKKKHIKAYPKIREYPDTPEVGVIYPIYPDKNWCPQKKLGFETHLPLPW